ncbi:hypothetical protein [Ciceribacter thiooxidans]|uniref:Uncharacterized protein n=1 Tax=Ciceribacter thiooxidans TaxID=1969821 RepID=A0ABV7I589_9HYPH|nr:hypothetical protein [Ciceribacter thiooxidans]
MTKIGKDAGLSRRLVRVRAVSVDRRGEPDGKHYGDWRKSADRSIEQAKGIPPKHTELHFSSPDIIVRLLCRLHFDADQLVRHLHDDELSEIAMTQPREQTVSVEVDLLFLSFLGHFTWENLQAPLFSSLESTTHFAGILICLRATLGDIGIALGAFWCTAWLGGGRYWVARPTFGATSLFIGIGLAVTIGVEFVSTDVLNRWSYGPAMPRVPIVGTGLGPLMQWLVVPMFVLWYLKRLANTDQRAMREKPKRFL